MGGDRGRGRQRESHLALPLVVAHPLTHPFSTGAARRVTWRAGAGRQAQHMAVFEPREVEEGDEIRLRSHVATLALQPTYTLHAALRPRAALRSSAPAPAPSSGGPEIPHGERPAAEAGQGEGEGEEGWVELGVHVLDRPNFG